jgi:hypothetical protein
MSNNADDNRNGFKNSRIDLSQLGDDGWNKPLTGSPATPGPRRKPTAIATPNAGSRRTHLDDLFESRVHAATARRAVKQNKGQNRVWLFAGGLFLASVGGIAAAYYLVGPPMAMSAYSTDEVLYQAEQTSSLEVDSNIAGTSSHFQGVTVSATMPDSTSGSSVMAEPSANSQSDTDTVTRDPVAPPVSAQPAAADTIAAQGEVAEPQQNDVAAVDVPADAAPPTMTAQPETERMVRIVPTAVSEEVETRTNVNTAAAPAASDATSGQWIAVPAETKPAAPSMVTAAAPQQPDASDPIVDPVKTQQELFKAFQDYLESTGHKVAGNSQSQEELFNKFIRWSMEAPKDN